MSRRLRRDISEFAERRCVTHLMEMSGPCELSKEAQHARACEQTD
jgi:hypothetical protein